MTAISGSTCPQLELVQENLKYYLDLRQHAKSDTLEWVRVPHCLRRCLVRVRIPPGTM